MKFRPVGIHPFMQPICDLLQEEGYELVTNSLVADFFIIGYCDIFEHQFWPSDKPTLILSDDDMYSDRDISYNRLEKGTMSESLPIVIPSVVESNLCDILTTLQVESIIQDNPNTLILRIFNYYGKHVYNGVIEAFITQANKNVPYTIESSGYQVRTFLYEDDFLDLFRIVFPMFISGNLTGIYNVGGTAESTVIGLTKTIDQLTCKTNLIEKKSVNHYICHWKIPDLTRIQAVTGWKPKTSLRKGLWQMLGNK